MYTITRNKIRDHYRDAACQPRAIGGTDALIRWQDLTDEDESDEGGGDANSEVTRMLAHRALEVARSEFEERTWNAFLRTAVDGARPADVAADLGMTVGAVYKAKSRVLRRLREQLAGLIE